MILSPRFIGDKGISIRKEDFLWGLFKSYNLQPRTQSLKI
jgi:hypothetical protein